jgi:hypothetical protein
MEPSNVVQAVGCGLTDNRIFRFPVNRWIARGIEPIAECAPRIRGPQILKGNGAGAHSTSEKNEPYLCQRYGWHDRFWLATEFVNQDNFIFQ